MTKLLSSKTATGVRRDTRGCLKPQHSPLGLARPKGKCSALAQLLSVPSVACKGFPVVPVKFVSPLAAVLPCGSTRPRVEHQRRTPPTTSSVVSVPRWQKSGQFNPKIRVHSRQFVSKSSLRFQKTYFHCQRNRLQTHFNVNVAT